MTIPLLNRQRNLILYMLIGGTCAFVDFLFYSALITISVNFMIANAVGVNIGILLSFSLNRKYNFKTKDKAKTRFLFFYLIGLTGLALSSLLLYIMIDLLNANNLYSKAITIAIVALFQFIMNKTITFRQTTNCAQHE